MCGIGCGEESHKNMANRIIQLLFAYLAYFQVANLSINCCSLAQQQTVTHRDACQHDVKYSNV